MSVLEDEDSALHDMLLQLRFTPNESTDAPEASSSVYAQNSEAEAAFSSTWVDLYRRYRKPMAPSTWKWSSNSRPGKHCDIHLLDYFTCLDRTSDKLGPGDPPELYCLPARELTAACMAHTLCEPRMFQVAKWCQEDGEANNRSKDCWVKIWEAQSCVRQSQILLSKTYWASSPDLMSTSERYMILLGAPTCPGKKAVSDDYKQRRKEFLESTLHAKKKLKPGDIPYVM